jgi:hypothetical protein
VFSGEGAGAFEGVECVLTIGGEGVRGEQSIVAFAFKVVSLDVFEEIIEAVFVVFVVCFLFAGLSLHLTTIRKDISVGY